MTIATLRRPPTPPADHLLTREEAAAKLRIAPGTLKHWEHQKRIPHVKIGKLTRYREADLDRYIAGQAVPVAED